MNARRPFLVALPALATALSLVLGSGTATLAHSPNPLLGTTPWDQDQIVGYQWWPGAVPPSWMATAIDAGAGDVGESRGSKAATFTRVSSASSRIAYAGGNPCPVYAIACMDRTGVPNSFAGMWFRPHGWVFDWGALRWCQGLPSPANGCFDGENVALDEFGHIEMLGHHANFPDESDYLDSVVQAISRARPKEGWNAHAFGRCDVARLQLEYELKASADLVSTCLALATSLSIVPSATSVQTGQAVRITGNLNIAVASGARLLSGDPLSRRNVVLQRRALGASTWSTIGTLAANPTAGSYGLTIAPTITYDYRVWFPSTPAEGVLASTSAVVRITVTPCTAIAGSEFGISVPCA